MKRKLSLILALIFCMTMVFGLTACTPKPTEETPDEPTDQGDDVVVDPDGDLEEIELTMASWRADDVAQVTALLAQYKELVPNVNITFLPINPPDYNSTLRLQLDSGTGPDLYYSRSYAPGEELFNAGFSADCSDIAGLMENFTAESLAPWQTADGTMFAVPFAAVSHGVYYNKDIFAANELEVPTTWEEFIAVCEALKAADITPLANGVADEWDILECFFLGMLPSFVGTGDVRAEYETGEKLLNDEAFVNTYAAMAEAAPYLPEGFEAVTYNDSQALFNTQSAAMFVDGSWTISVYDGVDFDWGVFAVPGPTEEDTAVCFHPDMAITMNTATAHPDEAKAFLAWLCTQDGASIASAALPTGFFPMINFPITLSDEHANEFLALNEGRSVDARFVWPVMLDLYTPMNEAVIGVLTGSMTPQAAADLVENARVALADAE